MVKWLDGGVNWRIAVYFILCYLQGLNPGLAIGEMKKMLALYNAKEAQRKVKAEQ